MDNLRACSQVRVTVVAVFRGLVSVAAAAMLAVALTACSADAAPAPSPTGFASEEEAFAAAEETYRAYVDALNEVDLSDPATFEGVYAWTTGEANAGARKSFSQMHADGWTVSGTSALTQLVHETAEQAEVVVSVCLDVSSINLTNPSGESVVDSDRPRVQAISVRSVPSTSSPTGLLISQLDGSEITCD